MFKMAGLRATSTSKPSRQIHRLFIFGVVGFGSEVKTVPSPARSMNLFPVIFDPILVGASAFVNVVKHEPNI